MTNWNYLPPNAKIHSSIDTKSSLEAMQYQATNKYRVSSKEERTYDGITFASKKEMMRYIQLKSMQSNGIISELVLQPVFIVHPSFKYQGKKIRAIKYIADFMYKRKYDTKIVIEDVKGYQTTNFKIKLKLLQYNVLRDNLDIEFKLT